MPEHFGMSRPSSVMEAVYVGRLDFNRLSELAPVVMKAAAHDDKVARRMLDEVVAEIVVTVSATIKRLRLADTDVHVVLGGGVLRGADRVMLEQIRSGIQATAPKATTLLLESPPVLGAALIGLDSVGAGSKAGARLRRTLTDRRLAAT